MICSSNVLIVSLPSSIGVLDLKVSYIFCCLKLYRLWRFLYGLFTSELTKLLMKLFSGSIFWPLCIYWLVFIISLLLILVHVAEKRYSVVIDYYLLGLDGDG